MCALITHAPPPRFIPPGFVPQQCLSAASVSGIRGDNHPSRAEHSQKKKSIPLAACCIIFSGRGKCHRILAGWWEQDRLGGEEGEAEEGDEVPSGLSDPSPPLPSSPLLSSPEGSSVDRQIFSLLIVEKERARRWSLGVNLHEYHFPTLCVCMCVCVVHSFNMETRESQGCHVSTSPVFVNACMCEALWTLLIHMLE